MSHTNPSSRGQSDRTRLLILALGAVIAVGGAIGFGMRAEDVSNRIAATTTTQVSQSSPSSPAGTDTSAGPSSTSLTDTPADLGPAAPDATLGSGTTPSATTQPETDDSTPPTTHPQTDDSTPTSTSETIPVPVALDCDALPPIASSALSMTSFEADVDGDGSPDDVAVYLDPDAFIWRLRVEFAAGLGSDTPIADPGSDIGAAALGAFDIEGDGQKEIFIRNGGEPDSFSIEIFGVSDCTVDPLLLNGEPVVFPMSFGNDELAGLACQNNQLLRKFATRSGTSVSFGGGTETFDLANGTLTSVGTALQTRTTTGAFALAAIDCPGVADS
jgi:hypothetical protein